MCRYLPTRPSYRSCPISLPPPRGTGHITDHQHGSPLPRPRPAVRERPGTAHCPGPGSRPSASTLSTHPHTLERPAHGRRPLQRLQLEREFAGRKRLAPEVAASPQPDQIGSQVYWEPQMSAATPVPPRPRHDCARHPGRAADIQAGRTGRRRPRARHRAVVAKAARGCRCHDGGQNVNTASCGEASKDDRITPGRAWPSSPPATPCWLVPAGPS